jgi:hypothetical protein
MKTVINQRHLIQVGPIAQRFYTQYLNVIYLTEILHAAAFNIAICSQRVKNS